MKLLVLFLVGLTFQALSASSLTKKMIQAMISDIERAVEAKDINGVADAF